MIHKAVKLSYKNCIHPTHKFSEKSTISDYTDLTKVCHKQRISTKRQLYSPERQRSLGHIDELQRQISSENLVTQTSIGERPLEPVDHLHSDFAAVGTNYWFVWPEGNCPPTEPGFSQGFFSILSPLACLVGESSFPAISST